MPQKIQGEFIIRKSDNVLYYHNPVTVPENTERVIVRYDYSPEKVKGEQWVNEIDLIVTDEQGDIGSRAHAVREVVISSYYSSDGYELRAPRGKWDVVFCAFRLMGDEVKVKYEVEFVPKKRAFYMGDTHCHSINSDGHHTYDYDADLAKKAGLDFLIMTDHNRSVLGDLPRREGVAMINGYEMTYPMGHVNLWGVKKPFAGTFVAHNREEWEKLRDEARANGAVVSLNHPLDAKCPWLWGLEDLKVDCVEVWNSVMRPDNQATIDWWHGRLAAGEKLPMVGGSDYHNDIVMPLFARPVTYVLAESKEPEDILKGIKEGRTSVADRPNDTFIDMTSGDARIGDTVKYTGADTVKIKVRKLRRGHTLYVKDGEGVLFEYKAKRTGDYETEVKVRGKGFVRAEIKNKYRGIKLLLMNVVLYFMIRNQAFKKMPDFTYALCSPIYFE